MPVMFQGGQPPAAIEAGAHPDASDVIKDAVTPVSIIGADR
jgi:hypothetical protein